MTADIEMPATKGIATAIESRERREIIADMCVTIFATDKYVSKMDTDNCKLKFCDELFVSGVQEGGGSGRPVVTGNVSRDVGNRNLTEFGLHGALNLGEAVIEHRRHVSPDRTKVIKA